MNHRKSSRNKQTKTDDTSHSFLRVGKLKKVFPSDIRGTSIYEIDINSSVTILNAADDTPSVKVCIAKVAPLALQKKHSDRSVQFSVVENPLIESHYPRFRDTDSESERKLPITEKADLTIQTSFSSNIQRGGARSFSSENKTQYLQSETPDSFSTFKKQVKKHIFRGLSLGEAGNLENELVHLHHHEHHHHYHFDKKHWDGDDSQMFSSKPSSCESQEAMIGGKKRFARRRRSYDEDNPKQTYYYTSETKSNATITKLVITSDPYDFPDVEEASKHQKFNSAKFSRSRASSSESILNKKSFLIKSHNYSDTELALCDSEDVTANDMFKKQDSTLVSSLNGVNVVQTPLGAPDQKTFSKSRSRNRPKSNTPITFSETETSENLPAEGKSAKKCEGLAPQVTVEDSGNILEATPSAAKTNTTENQDTEPVQAWVEKIKTEIIEIKKELRIIENEFFKKQSVVTEFNDNKSKSEDGSINEISVLSSKTFILKAENFYIIEESDSRLLSEDIDSFFESEDLCYAEMEKGCFYVKPNGSWVYLGSDGGETKICHTGSV